MSLKPKNNTKGRKNSTTKPSDNKDKENDVDSSRNANQVSTPAASHMEERPPSPLWSGLKHTYDFEDFANNVKKKNISKDELTL